MSGDVAHKMWRLCLAALVLVACACAAPLPPHGLGVGTVQLHPRVAPPAPHETIQIYAPRTGTWPSGRSPEVKPGGELRHAGHLFRGPSSRPQPPPYQGLIYDTSGSAGVESVRATGDVLARVPDPNTTFKSDQ